MFFLLLVLRLILYGGETLSPLAIGKFGYGGVISAPKQHLVLAPPPQMC